MSTKPVTGGTFRLESTIMKTRKNQPLTKWLLLLSIMMAITVSVQTFATEQKETKQKTDLTTLSIEDLMNVEVRSTATLTDTKPRLVPAAVTTVTADDIKSSGARSLFELLDIYVPNLQIIQHHYESDHMGLRGIINDRDDKYLLLVNGSVMNDTTHYGALSERDLPLLGDIHHIDVVRGPGSALYGPGAVSMVINIITYNIGTFQGTEFTSRLVAIDELYTGEFKHGQKFDDNDGGFFIYGGIGDHRGANKQNSPQIYAVDMPGSQFTIAGGGWSDQSWSFPGDGTKAGHAFTGPVTNYGESTDGYSPVKLQVQVTRDNWDIWARYTRGGQEMDWYTKDVARPPFGWIDVWDGGHIDWSTWPYPTLTSVPAMQVEAYGYQQATGYIGYKQELTNNIDIDYSGSYNTLDMIRVLGRSNPVAYYSEDYREDKYTGKAILKWQINDQHRIAFGTELLHSVLGLNNSMWPVESPQDTVLNPMPKWSTNMYSLLGEHQWTINDQWTTFLGARIDKHTYTDYMFSPRAAIVYTPTAIDAYKLIWSRSVRANFEEEMKAQAEAGGGKSSPEKLDSVEFRYERQQSKNLDLASSIFLHYSFELISWNSATGQNSALGTQRDWGAELEASYHTDKTRLTISHGYDKLIKFKLAPGITNTLATAQPNGYGNDLANWANNITKLTAQQKLDDKWTLDGSLRVYWGFPGLKDANKYYAAQAEPNPIEEPGWEKGYRGNYYLDLGLQYKASKNLTIGVTGYNLLGLINMDFNKRNYMGDPDYRDEPVAVGVSVTYKF
jgi:outer membrane receptor for ferrienterochelin and colicins